MTPQAFWDRFAAACKPETDQYEAWAFGVDADHLAQLVVTGQKTATASALPLYELENEPLPQAGEYSIILDGQENPVCIIKTTKVTLVPFREVSPRHAYKEGEGDRSLAYWQDVHQKCFSQWLDEAGLTFTPDMTVVCEEFSVVYP